MNRTRSLSELGNTVKSLTTSIGEFLDEANLPTPSFAQGSSSIYPDSLQDSRAELLDALDELRALVLGPTSNIYFTLILSPAWIATFGVLARYQIAHHVPLTSAISYAELSKRCVLDESDTKRIVRAAISLRIFEEASPGFIKHNAVSAVLATSIAQDAVGFFTEEFTPAALKLPETLRRFPGSHKAGESAAALANGSMGDRDIFSLISHDPERVRRFSGAMSFVTTVAETSLDHFVASVPWSPTRDIRLRSCPSPKIVVDMGGSRGDLCQALLRAYPGIEKAIVEDLPEVTKGNVNRGIAHEFLGRLQYQAYDFFTEQTIKGADVYTFRTVLHDWPDSYVIQILRNQIPAFKTGATILINDICIQATGKVWSIINQAQW